eukprot:gene21710-28094_t
MNLNRKVNHEDYSVDDMPEYPARTLFIHVLSKGVQVGSAFGLLITPIYSLTRKKPLVQTWRLIMPATSIAFTVISLGLLYGKDLQGQLTVAGVDDRAYRIKNNKKQNEVDRETLAGGTIGAIAGAVLTQRAWSAVIPSISTGIALGLVYHISKPYVNDSIEKL